jgi:hypothetical protein
MPETIANCPASQNQTIINMTNTAGSASQTSVAATAAGPQPELYLAELMSKAREFHADVGILSLWQPSNVTEFL